MNINFIINLLSVVGWMFMGVAIGGGVNELEWQTAISTSELFQHLVIFGLGLVLWGLSALVTLLRNAVKWLETGFAK